jgi:mRNA-degrading endonuclease RelE of RelBE toxin-antitoxin system
MAIEIKNVCELEKDFCKSCNSHFMRVRPFIKEVIVTKHFERDLKDEEMINSIVKSVLDCSHMEFHELHKFEENLDGNLIFRARKENLHIVYCVDKKMRIIFLRAIRNFDEYEKFLDEKKEIKKMIKSLKA